MQVLKKPNGALALATGLIVAGSLSFAPAAQAAWLKNPFAKPADITPPPPGMSDTEDANGNPVPTDKSENGSASSNNAAGTSASKAGASDHQKQDSQSQDAGKADANSGDGKWAARTPSNDSSNDPPKDHWYTLPWKRNANKFDNPPPGMKADPEDSPDSPVERGFANKAETQESRKNVEKTYRNRPGVDTVAGDPDLHLRMAKTLLARQNYKEALQQVNEALKLNDKLWEARYLGAYIFQIEGRYDEAMAKYKSYLAVKPDDLQAHINYGILLKRARQYDEAEDQYRKAIDINFNALEGHYNLANLFIENEKLEGALKELLICARIAPTNAMVHNNLGVIYQKRDYLEEAAEEFSRAANLDPANHTFSLNLDLLRDQLAHKKQAKTAKTTL